MKRTVELTSEIVIDEELVTLSLDNLGIGIKTAEGRVQLTHDQWVQILDEWTHYQRITELVAAPAVDAHFNIHQAAE